MIHKHANASLIYKKYFRLEKANYYQLALFLIYPRYINGYNYYLINTYFRDKLSINLVSGRIQLSALCIFNDQTMLTRIRQTKKVWALLADSSFFILLADSPFGILKGSKISLLFLICENKTFFRSASRYQKNYR